MPNNSGAAQVALLTPLPLPDGPPPPSLTSGTVALFQNNDWNSQALYISIDEHRSNERETIPSALFDQATWAAFNLPVGVVMTLMDNIVDPPSGNNADMSGCGNCVDFVGYRTDCCGRLVATGIALRTNTYILRQSC
jgi:hypothetical protein